MNRFVLILLFSLFNMVGAYAYTNSQHPSSSMRTVNRSMTTVSTTSVGGTSMSKQVTATQYRVSNNAFSSMPSMNVNTIVHSSSKYSQSGFVEPGSDSQLDGSRKIRGQQRAIDEDDKEEKEPETNDPYVPIGDAILPMMLLAVVYGIYLRRKNCVRIPDSGHQQ